MTLGMMLAMNSLATSLFGPLSQLVASALELQLVKGHMDRIDDVLQTPLEQDRDVAQQPPRLRGHVSVKNVSFKYGEQAPLVVQDVSLDIPPGMSVALVGPSGSGKSTLLNLLVRPLQAGHGRDHVRRPRRSTTWTCARSASRSASSRSTRSSSAARSARTSR